LRVVRAFSLIEIIVVILLIGVVFSLVLSSYANKKIDTKLLTVKDMPNYVFELSLSESSTLYIYGQKCDKGVLALDTKSYKELPNFGFNQEYKVHKRDKDNQLENIDFAEIKIDKKIENICFKLEFEKSRFLDKFIVSFSDKHYMFSPFYQEVESFSSFEEAKKAYSSKDLQLNSIDGYYRE